MREEQFDQMEKSRKEKERELRRLKKKYGIKKKDKE